MRHARSRSRNSGPLRPKELVQADFPPGEEGGVVSRSLLEDRLAPDIAFAAQDPELPGAGVDDPVLANPDPEIFLALHHVIALLASLAHPVTPEFYRPRCGKTSRAAREQSSRITAQAITKGVVGCLKMVGRLRSKTRWPVHMIP